MTDKGISVQQGTTADELLYLADQQAYARSRYNPEDSGLIRESLVIENALRNEAQRMLPVNAGSTSSDGDTPESVKAELHYFDSVAEKFADAHKGIAAACASPALVADREAIARIIGGAAFRPVLINGPFESETIKQKWLQVRDDAYYKADQIIAAMIPDGWKLVPVDPTIEMARAAEGFQYDEDKWDAMLAAAPTPNDRETSEWRKLACECDSFHGYTCERCKALSKGGGTKAGSEG